MIQKQRWKTASAFVATMGFFQPSALLANGLDTGEATVGPRSSALVAAQTISPLPNPL